MYITKMNDEFISIMMKRADAMNLFSLLSQVLPQVQGADADTVRRYINFSSNILAKLQGGTNEL